MKLRNKKTGKVYHASSADSLSCIRICLTPIGKTTQEDVILDSLTKLNEYYEDYTPKEPLIKDEKIRKAVRAWAEANNYMLARAGYDMVSDTEYGNVQIHFTESGIVDEDKYGVHSITELCGEEKE